MTATRDEARGTWMMYTRYRDWQGNIKEKRKRGFNTKREALAYEREFLLEKSNNLNMDFGTFVAMYLKNLKPRIKYNTYCSKVAVITSRIVPYFKNLNVSDITPMHGMGKSFGLVRTGKKVTMGTRQSHIDDHKAKNNIITGTPLLAFGKIRCSTRGTTFLGEK